MHGYYDIIGNTAGGSRHIITAAESRAGEGTLGRNDPSRGHCPPDISVTRVLLFTWKLSVAGTLPVTAGRIPNNDR